MVITGWTLESGPTKRSLKTVETSLAHYVYRAMPNEC